MCRSMVDILSATTENRREKKDIKKKLQDENIGLMSCPIQYRAAIAIIITLPNANNIH